MVRIFEAQNCDRKNLFEPKISFHQLWHVSNGKKALIWNVHFSFLKCFIKHWDKYQNIEREKYRRNKIRKSCKLANSFSCLWTFAETGCNSASSPNLKWTARSPRFPTGASLALSRWPPVLSSLNLFALFKNRLCMNNSTPWTLKVGYCSCLLLLWLTALYIVTGLGGQDDTLRYFFLLVNFFWSGSFHLIRHQEPDRQHRPACHGLHHRLLPHGADHRRLLNPP